MPDGMPLKQAFEEVALAVTDIQGHLDRFYGIGLASSKIIELGTRGGTSTIAFLAGLEGHGHLWSVDIDPPPDNLVVPHWTFVQGDDCSDEVLAQLPDDVDAVFIDTSHAYEHTLNELELYLPRVRSGGQLLLHDTELEAPDFVGPQPPFPVRLAVTEFCDEHGLSWMNFTHSYGLAVIEVP